MGEFIKEDVANLDISPEFVAKRIARVEEALVKRKKLAPMIVQALFEVNEAPVFDQASFDVKVNLICDAIRRVQSRKLSIRGYDPARKMLVIREEVGLLKSDDGFYPMAGYYINLRDGQIYYQRGIQDRDNKRLQEISEKLILENDDIGRWGLDNAPE